MVCVLCIKMYPEDARLVEPTMLVLRVQRNNTIIQEIIFKAGLLFMCLFVRSFVRSLARSFVRSFIRSFVRSFVCYVFDTIKYI